MICKYNQNKVKITIVYKSCCVDMQKGLLQQQAVKTCTMPGTQEPSFVQSVAATDMLSRLAGQRCSTFPGQYNTGDPSSLNGDPLSLIRLVLDTLFNCHREAGVKEETSHFTLLCSD